METNNINQGASIEKLPFASGCCLQISGDNQGCSLIHAFNRPSAPLGLGISNLPGPPKPLDPGPNFATSDFQRSPCLLCFLHFFVRTFDSLRHRAFRRQLQLRWVVDLVAPLRPRACHDCQRCRFATDSGSPNDRSCFQKWTSCPFSERAQAVCSQDSSWRWRYPSQGRRTGLHRSNTPSVSGSA